MLQAPRAGMPDMPLSDQFDAIADRLEALRETGQAWYPGERSAPSGGTSGD
jgi:hypothetical protein